MNLNFHVLQFESYSKFQHKIDCGIYFAAIDFDYECLLQMQYQIRILTNKFISKIDVIS